MEEARRALGGPIDWRILLDLAREQAVLPTVARRLASDHPDQVPRPVLEELESEARSIARFNLGATEALLDLVAALEAGGVSALPFKGPSLAVQAYGDLGLRSFADLDLLVQPRQLARAREILLARGLRPSYPTSPGRRALLIRRGSHESLERDDGLLVELHWRVASSVSDFDMDYERLWRRLGKLTLAGRSIPALEPADHLLVLSLHGTKHAWERLSWICDVAELVRAEPDLDWDTACSEAERMRARRVLHLALQLASDLLGARLPAPVAAARAEDRALGSLAAHVRDGLFLPPRSGAGTLGFHLGTREGLRAKAALVIGSLGALNQRDLELLALPDAALPLYYLTRPARLAAKAIAHAVRGTPRR